MASQTAITQAYRSPRPSMPFFLGDILTPSVTPFDRSDGLWAVVGFDNSWLLVGEDGQMHVVNKIDLSTFRVDRSPSWPTPVVPWTPTGSATDPWNTGMSGLVAGFDSNNDSPNPYLIGAARQTWTYSDPGLAINITTGYAIVVGTGDYNGTLYRSPSVFFWREGAPAAQSLTQLLNAAGIMGGVTASPRNLQGAVNTATDTFFLYGSGENQSTDVAASRATFGKAVLTLNGAKTQTGPTAVSSLTWTDYLPTLQAQMPAGETIVNVPAAGGIIGPTMHVLVVTQDGSNVIRARMVLFDTTVFTATLDTKLDVLGATIWPLVLTTAVTSQVATICAGANGVAWAIVKGGGVNAAYYRANAETSWRPVLAQVQRCFGIGDGGINSINWDATNSRFIVAGGYTAQGEAGWADADFKQGHPLTGLMPAPLRWPSDNARGVRSAWSDERGTLLVGNRQLAVLIPTDNLDHPPTRVLWGLRVTVTAANDTVQVSEGEALIFNYNAAPTRVYFTGGTVGSLTATTEPYTIALTAASAVGRPGNGFASGTDYPEPALRSQVILATVTRTATGVPITTAEIDQATFREADTISASASGGSLPARPSLQLIASSVLAAPAASQVFSAIPGIYNHLRLVVVAACNFALEAVNMTLQFNGDTASHYDSLSLYESSPTAAAATVTTDTVAYLGKMPGASATAGCAGTFVLDIPAYSGTAFFKQFNGSGGYNDVAAAAADTLVWEFIDKWRSTAAITSITLAPGAGNFVAGSAFYLYGIV